MDTPLVVILHLAKKCCNYTVGPDILDTILRSRLYIDTPPVVILPNATFG